VRYNNPIVVGLDIRGKTPHVPIIVIDKVRERHKDIIKKDAEELKKIFNSISW
jgi:hypothetical protein